MIGMESVLHQDCHRSGNSQVLEGEGLALLGTAEHNSAHTLAEVAKRTGKVRTVGQSKNRHQFGSNADVETRLPGPPFVASSQSDDHVSQRPIVDVENPVPLQIENVDPQPIQPDLLQPFVRHASFVVPASVDGGSHQIVRGGDGMNVTSEMKVELVHGHHLAVTPASRTALDAERRAHRWLAYAGNCVLADRPQTLDQSDGGSGLAFAQWRRCDRGHVDVLPAGVGTDSFQNIEMNLGFRLAVRDQVIIG